MDDDERVEVDDVSIEDLYERIGNDPRQWELRADALRFSSDAVSTQIGGAPSSEGSEEDVWDWVLKQGVVRMLRGMALECLIKALWLAGGRDLVEGGRMAGIPRAKAHDLYAMLNETVGSGKSGLSEAELYLLARLSRAIVSGRYPIAKKPVGAYPTAPAAHRKIMWNRMSPEDEETFLSLWGKLEARIRESLDGAD